MCHQDEIPPKNLLFIYCHGIRTAVFSSFFLFFYSLLMYQCAAGISCCDCYTVHPTQNTHSYVTDIPFGWWRTKYKYFWKKTYNRRPFAAWQTVVTYKIQDKREKIDAPGELKSLMHECSVTQIWILFNFIVHDVFFLEIVV